MAYLEFNPSEQSLRDQLELAEKKLKSLHSQVDAEVGVSVLPRVRQKWLDKNGAKGISAQIKNLRYLLGE